MSKKKISLKDIAQRAGVSTALVSYVLNGKGKSMRAGKEITIKINQIARELNYQPNHLAKSLRSGKSYTIGLVIADISNPFFANIARVVENEALRLGYTVLYGSSDEDAGKSRDLMNVLINRQVDGLIIVSSENSEDQVEQLIDRNIDFVLLDRHFPELKTNFVSTDNYKASFASGDHLVKMGYRNIGLIAYKSRFFHMQERIRGYKEALRQHGLPFKKKWLQEVQFSNAKTEVRTAIDKMFASPQPVEAIIFATYSLAVYGLQYINERGIKVPDDIAIVSFGQAELFDLYSCPISYVLQDMENLGKQAVNILVNKINNPKEPLRQLFIEAKLVTRASSAKKRLAVNVKKNSSRQHIP